MDDYFLKTPLKSTDDEVIVSYSMIDHNTATCYRKGFQNKNGTGGEYIPQSETQAKEWYYEYVFIKIMESKDTNHVQVDRRKSK